MLYQLNSTLSLLSSIAAVIPMLRDSCFCHLRSGLPIVLVPAPMPV